MMKRPSLTFRETWVILALAVAGAILYALTQEQYARLSITFAMPERAVKIRDFLETLPIDVLHGRGMAPWQYRFAVYGPAGWLLEHGVPAIPLSTAVRTFFLFTWALALQGFVARWFPALAYRALVLASCFLLGILAIPWYIYNLDDFPMLTALTIAFAAMFEGRWLLACGLPCAPQLARRPRPASGWHGCFSTSPGSSKASRHGCAPASSPSRRRCPPRSRCWCSARRALTSGFISRSTWIGGW